MKKPKSAEAERLIQAVQALIKAGKVRSFTDAAKKAGYQSQDFTDLKSGKKDLQRLFLDDLCNIHPINRDYIVTGKGEMLKTDTTNQPESQPKQLEFDFNKWMQIEEVKANSFKEVTEANKLMAESNKILAQHTTEVIKEIKDTLVRLEQQIAKNGVDVQQGDNVISAAASGFNSEK